MILITGFEAFGIVGTLTKFNPSKEVALKLSKEFNVDVLILPVRRECLELLNNKLVSNKYKFIFMLGQCPHEHRIETQTSRGVKSDFAISIKNKLGIMKKTNIGRYYCDKIFAKSLEKNKKTIFIHIPREYDYEYIKKIFVECLKW